jgi:hypothetical protein
MKKTVLKFIMVLSGFSVCAQNDCENCNVDLSCLQGLFRIIFVSHDFDFEKIQNYDLYDSTYNLGVYYFVDDSITANVSFSRVGFIDELGRDSIFPSELRMVGKYYVSTTFHWNDNQKEPVYYGTGMYPVDCEAEGYEQGAINAQRMDNIPIQIWNLIEKQGIIDNRNYIEIFKMQRYSPFNKILKECDVYRDRYGKEISFKNNKPTIVNIVNNSSFTGRVKIAVIGDNAKIGWVSRSSIQDK